MAEFVQSEMKVVKIGKSVEPIYSLFCCKCDGLLTIKYLKNQFMKRVYPKGTKVLHRFKDCGLGSVLWANDEFIAVRFENGDEYAYHPEDIKRLDYPIRSNEIT